MTRVIDHVEGHYETQRTSYGEAYVWRPECIVVECDCGETLHPWESEYREWLERKDEILRSEELYQQEWNAID